MHLRAFFATACLMLVLLSGCAAIVRQPAVTIKDASLAGLDASGVDINLHLGVTNPNLYDLSLLGYTYELRVQTLPLSAGGLQQTVVFPAGEQTELQVPVHLKFADLLRIIRRTSDPDNIPCLITARLQIQTPLGEMTIPAEKQTVLAVPEQYRPAAYLDRLQDALRGLR
jgi:LEA14-like dessication related protein